jgi:fructokinase
LVVGLGEVLWDLLPEGAQLGGAPANFAYHAAALGARAVVAGAVGDDDLGRELVARLRAAGCAVAERDQTGGSAGGANAVLDISYLAIDPAHPTGTVTVALDGDGKPHYTIHEGVAWDYIPASERLMALAARADAVCFGSLAQRMPVSRATIERFLGATRPDCLRVFDINLRQHYYSEEVLRASLDQADVLKINDEELPALLQMVAPYAVMDPSLYSDPDFARSPRGVAIRQANDVRELCAKFRLRAVALTRGANGCILKVAEEDEVADEPGIAPARVADTVGAGDAFTAALVTGLLAGRDARAIATHANRLASYVCSQHGAMPPVPEDLRSAGACQGRSYHFGCARNQRAAPL